jgi:hypothetical protein
VGLLFQDEGLAIRDVSNAAVEWLNNCDDHIDAMRKDIAKANSPEQKDSTAKTSNRLADDVALNLPGFLFRQVLTEP